jgi:hypothetical protein
MRRMIVSSPLRAALAPPALLLGIVLAITPAARGQSPEPDPSPQPGASGEGETGTAAEPDPAAAPEGGEEAGDEPVAAPAGEEEPRERKTPGFLPRLDVFFPEGDLDLRVSRLIDKVYFAGQVSYNFIDGDITAFLRYRYYGYRRTYQLTGFDSLEFDDLEELSDEFQRVRGFLVLTEWPTDYNHRTVFLAEIDRIISNKEALRFDTNKTDTFVRLGYQIGTPYDPASNAILGERRAQIRTLFTAFRDIGRGDFGLTSAVTYGFDVVGGDFHYVKLEAEGLKRVDLPRDLFLIGRIHGGSFPLKEERDLAEFAPDVAAGIDEIEDVDRYTIPRAELFRLDGRSALKGLDEAVRGTEQLYTTVELFVPWFVSAERRAIGLDWENWYWILYGGYGATAFDDSIYGDLDQWVPDLGIGFESSFRLRKYTFFLSGIVAQALEGGGDVEARVSIKSYR